MISAGKLLNLRGQAKKWTPITAATKKLFTSTMDNVLG